MFENPAADSQRTLETVIHRVPKIGTYSKNSVSIVWLKQSECEII